MTDTTPPQNEQLTYEAVQANGRHDFLNEVLQRYEEVDTADSETAVHLRRQFLHALQDQPMLLQESRYADFLAAHIDPEDLAELEWDSPRHMMRFSESLYQSRFKDAQRATQLKQHASVLLRRALYQYEKEGEMEKLFQLLRLAPTYLLHQDEELSRLHYRANTYEIRRVRRNRRWLHIYLALQIVLVLLVFPYLFINAENGRLQNQVEELADVEIGDEGYQLVSYSEGVYWAVITAGSIGYGDVTPRTTTGRIIAGALGTMGVITVGILAGLVLDWITPRRIM
ncbi:MAG: two pore domain potassium channel family protein [Anaerolineales bacterium]|nr:two pore domain potassium channel family protein [Anaerolineales bacterium]